MNFPSAFSLMNYYTQADPIEFHYDLSILRERKKQSFQVRTLFKIYFFKPPA